MKPIPISFTLDVRLPLSNVFIGAMTYMGIFVASNVKSALLINKNGHFEQTDPIKIGLPIMGKTANWVDYDNDGLPDLHIVPGGLYRQRPDHTFEATNLLAHQTSSSISEARSTWFDLDNDGARDLLMAVRYHSPWWVKIAPKWWTKVAKVVPWIKKIFGTWKITLYRSIPPANHWLELKLVGPAGNRQAIGTSVIIETSNRKMLQQVGISEGSHYSQGHYRLYFGLGSHNHFDSMTVIWPDGHFQLIQNLKADQLLIIDYSKGVIASN